MDVAAHADNPFGAPEHPSPQPVDTLSRVETPENVRLVFRLAGPATRMYAYLLDLLLRIALAWGLGWLILLIAPVVSFSALPFGILLLLVFFLEWGYTTLFEAFWGGKTPGKHILGLRVVKVGGYPIGFFDSMLRNLLRAADFLPVFYGVGLLSTFATRRLQRLGDLVAGTVVVREEVTRLRGKLRLLKDVEPIPLSEMTSGYRPSERTLVLIDRFFRRRHDLHSARAEEVAAILATPLAERLGYRGDDELVEKPSRFLLRVLRTFSEAPRERRPTSVEEAVTAAGEAPSGGLP